MTFVTFESLLPTNADRGRTALACASLGWRVLPLRPTDKKPALRGWPTLATTDPEVIQEWWDANGPFPHCNVGVATGRESGVWVLDVDVGVENGYATLRALLAQHGAANLPRTFTVKTPSGGLHIYFRYPVDIEVKNSARKLLGAGLDTRGWHGQVVAPTTRLATARGIGTYEVVDPAAPAEAPAWPPSLVERKPYEPVLVDLVQVGPRAGRLAAYVRKVLANEAAELAAMGPASGRNQRLNDTAFMLGGWGAYGVVSRDEAHAALADACARNGLIEEDGARQFEATFESGWGDGLEVPRELPVFMREEQTR
jgi:Bifunctional DNA primase/polymerase, N-terminal